MDIKIFLGVLFVYCSVCFFCSLARAAGKPAPKPIDPDCVAPHPFRK